jgi:hypothetical protein
MTIDRRRFLLMLASLSTTAPPAEANADAVPRFSVYETTLTAATDSVNPYAAVEAVATVQRPNGTRLQLPLFWDGGRTWKLRLSPDAVGEWRWSVRSDDAGLHGKSGAFHCEPSDRRGGIQPMAGYPYHFEWQNGTPCWFCGDTAWALYTDNAEEKHNRETVQHYLDVRSKQGFNVIHSMLISEADWGNAGGMPFIDLAAERINPAYWREVDARVRYLTEKGLVAGLVLAWTDKGKSNQSWQHFPSDEACLRYARYIVARYSAFPVFFIIAGEWAMTNDDAAAHRLYEKIGAEVRKSDPHNRMRAVHTNGRGAEHLKPFAGESWHSFGDYMQTYDNLHSSILACRDLKQPVVNAEYAYYRREAEDGTVNKANSAEVDVTRAATWDIVMAGGYVVTGFGTTYFGGLRCRGPFDVDAAKNDDWETQVQHLLAFFTAREWWKLTPRDDLLTAPVERGKDENVRGDRSGRPPRIAYWALAEPGREYLAYVRGVGDVTLSLGDGVGGVGGKTFTVRRFDPRTGAYTALPDHQGQSLRLETPDERDWAFEVRVKA